MTTSALAKLFGGKSAVPNDAEADWLLKFARVNQAFFYTPFSKQPKLMPGLLELLKEKPEGYELGEIRPPPPWTIPEFVLRIPRRGDKPNPAAARLLSSERLFAQTQWSVWRDAVEERRRGLMLALDGDDQALRLNPELHKHAKAVLKKIAASGPPPPELSF